MEKGIKESKELVVFISKLINGIIKSAEDKEFSFSDVQHFVPAGKDLTKSLEGLSDIPAELKDLDSDEIEELLVAVTEGLEAPAVVDDVRNIIEIAKNLLAIYKRRK